MKKLFAGIVAALALIPVVANAASYSVGEYVNFAGNDSDWTAFNTVGSAADAQEWLDNSGVPGYYISDATTEGYLKVLQIYQSVGESGADLSTTTSIAYSKTLEAIDTAVTTPYGRTENGAFAVATYDEIAGVLGITGTTIPVNAKNTKILNKITVSADLPAINEPIVYVFTSTSGTATGTYKAVKVTRANGEVTEYELVEIDPEDSAIEYSFLFTTIEMNEAYVCKTATTDTYSCYECPTTEENKTEYLWRKDGSQADACKKVEKITSKAKCVKSPKTGVDSYLVPSAIVLGVCAIVLTVLKRKDAFKAI